MRVLLQRVLHACVAVDGKTVSSIGPGLLVLVGIKAGDTQDDIDYLVHKIVNLRIFPDNDGVMNLSVLDCGGEILAVSQFTLYASAKEGNRPSFVKAMAPEKAKTLFGYWNGLLRERFPELGEGVFGADMKVELINDGPFTLWLDSDEIFGGKQ